MPRLVSAARRIVLPPWLKGRASVYLDGLDDVLTGTIPVDMAGDGPLTLLARIRPSSKPDTNRGAVAIGTNAANQGAFVGPVDVGGNCFLGGGLLGNVLADSRPIEIGVSTPCMLRLAGGVDGAMTFVADNRAANGIASPNIAGTVAMLGRLLAGATWYRGQIADVRVLSRAISDAEYDAWRIGADAPANARRWWSCENPGWGTVCREEIGGTDDPLTGGVYDRSVPFKRPMTRVHVPAAPANRLVTVPHHANLDPGAGSFGAMGHFKRSVDPCYSIRKGSVAPSWRLYTSGANGYGLLQDGTIEIFVYNAADRWPLGEWLHYALIVDRTLGKAFLYLNAKRPAVVNLGALGGVGNAGPLYLLVTNNGSVNDTVFVKGRPLLWDEIEAHCCDGIIPADAISWGAREGAGTVVASSPSGYSGTLEVASWTERTRSKARAAAGARQVFA